MQIVFWSMIIWLFTHIFIFQSSEIPTSSMRPALMEGDHILVNKLAYGARIPITPLSLPIGNTFVDWIRLPYMRIPGYSSVKRNDVIIFNYPMDDDLPVDERKGYVKRCIGLPGDTIKIKKGIVYINNRTITDPENILYKYHVEILKDGDRTILKDYDGYESFSNNSDNYVNISDREATL